MASLRVFVSRCDKEHAWCDAFVAGLKSRGLEVWYDQQLQYVGAQWAKKIEEELDGRAVFLMALTPDAWAAPSVLSELGQALKQRKQIVGALHKMTQLSGFMLAHCQLIDTVGLDGQAAGQIAAASLNGTQARLWPLRSASQPMPTPSGAGQVDLSGVWYLEGNPTHTRLALTQQGTRITGSGRHWLWQKIVIAGTIAGTSVTLQVTPAEADPIISVCELHLTFLPPGKMEGYLRYV